MVFHKGDRIVFLHAEKTGGTTLHSVLSSLFDAERICPERYEDISRWPEITLHQYDFFSAHATLEDLATVARPYKLITILRDPFERTLSLYDFWRSIKPEVVQSDNLHGPRLAQTLSPAEFFAPHNNWRTRATNRYTELLTKNSADRSGAELQNNYERRAETAMKALDRFDFVAFAEDLDGSYDRLSQLLDIPRQQKLPKLNVTNHNHIEYPEMFERRDEIVIDRELSALIEMLNRCDQMVYDYAVQKYFPGDRVPRNLVLWSAAGVSVRSGRNTNWCSRVGLGSLLHGPYCRLRAGVYTATLTTNLRQGIEFSNIIDRVINFDVSSDSGNNVLDEVYLSVDEVIKGKIEVNFTVPEFKRDIEIRIYIENFPELEFSVDVLLKIMSII